MIVQKPTIGVWNLHILIKFLEMIHLFTWVQTSQCCLLVIPLADPNFEQMFNVNCSLLMRCYNPYCKTFCSAHVETHL